jgi:cyclopropane-fatty-acyl-phospholipid synthase
MPLHHGVAVDMPSSTVSASPRLTASDDAGAAVRILRILLRGIDAAAFRIGSGPVHRVGSGEPAFTLVLRDPSALRRLLLGADSLSLADAYIHDRIDFEGDFFAALALKNHFRALRPSLRDRASLLREALRLPRTTAGAGTADASVDGRNAFRHRHSRNSDRQAIAFHYDASNRFYGLWLDRQMVYSCGYFESPDDAIDRAQASKLDHICRKLRLSPGERFLDIGCGWGALVCWSARHYGVRAHGITLSRQQLAFARERIAAEGLQDLVSVELCDYRDLQGEAVYDKVASVGMFEHVGLAKLPTYHATVHRVLRPGGLFLNHGITRDEEGWRRTPETEFINRYIFPDAEIDLVGNVQRGMELGGFEIHDVEGLRMHYGLTLRHWVRRLEAAREQAVQEVGEVRYRLWRLYMAACALQFEDGAMRIYQILASRAASGPAPVPLTRRYLYG